MNPATESQFEATTIQRLRALGYGWCPTYYQPASTLDRNLKSVVLAGRPACAMHADRLRAHLTRRYPHMPAKVLNEALAPARNPARDVYAGVVTAVKLVLRKRRIRGEQFQFILRRVMQQAEAGYEDWPMVA